MNYAVSCSGDNVTCPPNLTTTDNRIAVTNLTTMSTYTFSVVAINSIGEGEAGVLNYTTPGEVKNAFVHEHIRIYNINKPQSKLKRYT